MEMTVSQSLSQAWARAVSEGKIVNEFPANNNDPSGQWQHGNIIRFGLRLENGRPEYFARNVTRGTDLTATLAEREVGDTGFQIQFNGWRALRPGGKRPSIGKQPDVPDNCRFFCHDPNQNLSILRRDPLIQVALANWRWDAYYNATPFEKEGHVLWIPVSVENTRTLIPHLPQAITPDFLEDAVVLFRNSRRAIILFNSLHAGASVDHLHFQGVYHKQELAIERALFSDEPVSLLDDFLFEVLAFSQESEANEIFPWIDRFQSRGIPFNLIMVGERIYLIPRNPDHEVVEEFPSGAIASMELAGKMITSDYQLYENMDDGRLRRALKKTTLSRETILQIVKS